MKIYLASSMNKENRNNINLAKMLLKDKGFEVYNPCENIIPHAWDYPNTEWAQMVFANDISAINDCDILVLLSYGRNSTAGANWEAGYAYGIGKPIIVVEMTDEPMSLMVANGRWATVKGLKELSEYDFENMPKSRTDTEQK